MPPCPAPALQALVHFKWRAFARRLLIAQLCCYLLWLGAFTGFMLLFQSEDARLPNDKLIHTWHVSPRARCAPRMCMHACVHVHTSDMSGSQVHVIL